MIWNLFLCIMAYVYEYDVFSLQRQIVQGTLICFQSKNAQ
jgi:hypothetical protein